MIRLVPQPQIIKEKGGFCKSNEMICVKNMSFTNKDAYRIVADEKITIYAGDERGFFYAQKTIKQLNALYGESIPRCEIEDCPVFSYRGFMLDCARHMIDFDEIKKFIDLASDLKLNKFHWHLSDDQGFRIELETIPELTEKGSVRNGDNFGSMCKSDKPYGGYYTKKQIAEIVEYCKERYIDVIPEIDIPGHSSAILHVFPELSCKKEPVEVKMRQGIYKDNFCIGNADTFEFIKKLLDELCDMFPYEYFHIGGDEAPNDYREDCPLCNNALKENGLKNFNELQCVFSNKISDYLKTKGKKAIVWNDILKGKKLDSDIVIQRWMDKKNLAPEYANRGSKVIISDFSPYYFDYPYGMYPLQKVYSYNPLGNKVLDKNGRKNIIGTEAPMWTEFVDNPQRLEYMLVPRWFAFAENSWTEQKNKDYPSFKEATQLLTNSMTDFNVAPLCDWDMPKLKRLSDTASFFNKFLKK